MATFTKQNTFSAGAATSAAVNQNFDDIAAFLNNSVVHTDGSKAMTAPLSLPNSDPTGPNQATRKQYVDTAVGHRAKFADAIMAGYSGTVNLGEFWEPIVQGETRGDITTDASGNAHIAFPAAFPNGLLTVLPGNGDSAAGWAHVEVKLADKAGFDVHVTDAAGNPLAAHGVRTNYIALGW